MAEAHVVMLDEPEVMARRVHAYMINYQRRNKEAPTLRELRKAFSMGNIKLVRLLDVLMGRGQVVKKTGQRPYIAIDTPAVFKLEKVEI